MIAVITLLVGLLLSLVAVRIATIALTLTGVSKPLAQFQARSAFTGCGFATSESEQVVNHPVRRRVIMLLMFVGPAGIVTTAGAVVAGPGRRGRGGTSRGWRCGSGPCGSRPAWRRCGWRPTARSSTA